MKIVIPGTPVPQARMKHSNRRGFVTTYDPRAKEKEHIRFVLGAYKTDNILDFPRISFLFHMPIPKSIRKKDVELYNSGLLKHDKKPDVDNLVKLYLDCLDGIVIYGDQKVALGSCMKLYHPEPKTIVWVNDTCDRISEEEMSHFPPDTEFDLLKRVGKVFQTCSYTP